MDILPCKLTAGITFEHVAVTCDYPAPDWALTAYLRGPENIDLAATADGAAHAFAETAATTAAWPAGIYAYSVRAMRGAEVREVERGTLEIVADLAAISGAHDSSTHAQRTLAAIEAVLENRATHDQERYVINNREAWRTPIPDLLKLRDLYRAEVRREQAAACGKSLWGPAVRVRF